MLLVQLHIYCKFTAECISYKNFKNMSIIVKDVDKRY